MTDLEDEIVAEIALTLAALKARVARVEAQMRGEGRVTPFPQSAMRRKTAMAGSAHYCSFCGAGQNEVANLIAGPGLIFICNECVRICHEIEQKRMARDRSAIG